MPVPDWKKHLQTGGNPPPTGNPNLIDVSPLSEPVNAFGFVAAHIRAQRDTGRYPESAEESTATDQQLAWLDYLTAEIPFETQHPVEALTIARLSCNQGARGTFSAALAGIEAIGRAAEEQRKAGGGQAG